MSGFIYETTLNALGSRFIASYPASVTPFHFHTHYRIISIQVQFPRGYCEYVVLVMKTPTAIAMLRRCSYINLKAPFWTGWFEISVFFKAKEDRTSKNTAGRIGKQTVELSELP